MGKKDDQASGPSEIQVVELTMDNPEDQDELNRRLRKPGEPNGSPTARGESTKRAANGDIQDS